MTYIIYYCHLFVVTCETLTDDKTAKRLVSSSSFKNDVSENYLFILPAYKCIIPAWNICDSVCILF